MQKHKDLAITLKKVARIVKYGSDSMQDETLALDIEVTGRRS